MTVAKNIKMLQIAMMTIIIGFCFMVAPSLAFAQNPTEHEYAKITRGWVTAALATSGGKKEIKLAEASLMALGWFVLYGNDSKSAELAETMSEIVTDEYKGTDKMNVIYLNHTLDAYFEMLNLGRFEKRKPDNPSDEYSKIVKSRIEKALANDAGYEEFRSAEGSLAALGWMTLFGNDANSVKLANQMATKASNEWRGANEVYTLQSSEAYGEMINLGRFKLNASKVTPIPSPKLTDAQVLNRWAAQTNVGLPKELGEFQLAKASTICPIGCDFSTSFQYISLKVNARGYQQTAPITQLESKLKPLLLVEYCKSEAFKRNIQLLVDFANRGQNVGFHSFWIGPGNCLAK